MPPTGTDDTSAAGPGATGPGATESGATGSRAADSGAADSRASGTGPARVVPCVGAVVHDAAGRLLLIRRGHDPHRGLWSLPGGRIEAGESPEQAVVRDVREETGLGVVPGRPVGRVTIPGDGVVFDVLDLACELSHPDAPPLPGDDATEALFADAATIEGLPCTPLLVETLRGWGVLPH
jgi:8-oxo-dGTP diphosphatase